MTAPSGIPSEKDPLAAMGDYDIRHLGEHLEVLGDHGTFARLLRLDWCERIAVPAEPGLLRRFLRRPAPPGGRLIWHPAWFEAKNRANLAADFVEDVHRAWRLAATASAAALEAGGPAHTIGLEGRYALLLASFNSYAATVPVHLVVALVRADIWTAPQAVAYCRRIADPAERLTGLNAILPVIGQPQRLDVVTQAYAAAQEATADQLNGAVRLPDELTAQLPESLVRQALERQSGPRPALLGRLAELGCTDDAMRLAIGDWQGQVAIAPWLTQEQVRRWLSHPEDGSSESGQAALYVRLAVFGHLTEALRLARGLQFPGPRAVALIGVAAQAKADSWEQVRAAADDLLRPDDVVRVLAALAAADPTAAGRSLLDDALALLPDGVSGLDLVVELAPRLDQRQLQAAAAFALKEAGTSYPGLVALFAIAGVTTGALRSRVLAAALRHDKLEPKALLGRLLPAGWATVDPAAALDAARQAKCVPQAMEHLAPHLPRDLLRAALADSIVPTGSPWRQLRLEREVAVALAATDPAEAVRRVQDCPDEQERAMGLIDLAAALPDDHLAEVLRLGRAIGVGDYRVPVMQSLAPRLSGERLAEALDGCRGEYERLWARSLGAFTPRLSATQLRTALTEADDLRSDVERGWAYAALADHLPVDDLPELEHRIRSVGVKAAYQANTALSRLAVRFCACGSPEHALDLLAEIPADRVPSTGVQVVIDMAGHLPADLIPKALDLLGAQRTNPSLAPVIACLGQDERASWLRQVLNPEAIDENLDRSAALAVLASTLGEPSAGAVLEAVAGADSGSALGSIAMLAPLLDDQQAQRALGMVRAAPNLYAAERSRALLALAGRGGDGAEQRLEEALIDALDATPQRHLGSDSQDRPGLWQALRNRLAVLPAQRRQSIVRRALTELSDRSRDDILAGLGELMPLMAALGGPAAIEQVLTASSDVNRWWP